MINRNKKNLKSKLEDFVIEWSCFPIDLWWRKKYNIPFGSLQHRSMNFIDMAIEYQESLLWSKSLEGKESYSEEEGYIDGMLKEENAIPLTQEQIDADYDNLNLEEFDNL